MNKDDLEILELQNKLEYVFRRQREKEMDLVTMFSGELHKGDLIIVSGNNSAYLAFYLGRGQGGTMQHFSLRQLTEWLDNKDNSRYNTKKGGPYVWYVNSPHANRISKYSPELLVKHWRDEYDKALLALKTLKVIQ